MDDSLILLKTYNILPLNKCAIEFQRNNKAKIYFVNTDMKTLTLEHNSTISKKFTGISQPLRTTKYGFYELYPDLVRFLI